MNLLDRPLKVGLISASDRASGGVYQDQGLPSLKAWLDGALLTACEYTERLIPDEQAVIEATLIELVDTARCDLVLTTGGTGPALRDVTPEATRAVAHKEMPGFGEQMRQISLRFVATAILSRQTAVIRYHPAAPDNPGTPGVPGKSGQPPRPTRHTLRRAHHQPAGPAQSDQGNPRRPARP